MLLIFFLLVVINRLGLVCCLVLWVEQGVYVIFEFFFTFICMLWWVNLWCFELYALIFFLRIVVNRLGLVCCLVLWVSQESILYLSFYFLFWQVFVRYGEWICGAFNCLYDFDYFLHIVVNRWGWFCELNKESTLYLRFFSFFGRYLYSIR